MCLYCIIDVLELSTHYLQIICCKDPARIPSSAPSTLRLPCSSRRTLVLTQQSPTPTYSPNSSTRVMVDPRPSSPGHPRLFDYKRNSHILGATE